MLGKLLYVGKLNCIIQVSSNREVVDALNSLSKNGCCIKLKIKNVADESGSDSGEHQNEAQDLNIQVSDILSTFCGY